MYDESGSRVGTVSKADTAGTYKATVLETLDSVYGILQYTVPVGAVQIRLTTKAPRVDVLMTKNQPFDYKTMLSALPLRNLFSVKAENSYPDKWNSEGTLSGYCASETIAVCAGDVLYFGIANLQQGWHLRGYDENGNQTVSLSKADIDIYSKLSDTAGVIRYSVPNGVTQVRLTTNYSDHRMIVTKNQPFTAEICTEILKGTETELGKATNAAALTTHPIAVQNRYVCAGTGLAGATVDSVTENSGFLVSKPISVAAGDVIYLGLLDPTQGWNICGYNASGNRVGNYAGRTQLAETGQTQTTVLESLSSTRAILSWTVPSGITQIRITTRVTDYPILVTQNQPFDLEFYRAAFFPKNEYQPARLDIPSASNINGYVSNTGYVSSAPIAVREGDVLTFGPCSNNQKWFLALYTGNGTGLNGGTTVGWDDAVVFASISESESILCYTVPANVTHVKLTVLREYSKDAVLTVNFPFDGVTYQWYKKELVASDYGQETNVRESPLNQRTALFLGDSITAGTYDLLSPTEGKSWAGRLSASTGLTVTNAGVGGSTVAKLEGKGWIYDQYTAHSEDDYDLIVMGGGVNDARNQIAIGSIAESESEPLDVTTFAGGLQQLFSAVRSNWKQAKLFYIANYRLDGCTTGSAQDMSAYFAVAKQLCATYGITYIDLYGNTELNLRLQSASTRYLPDLLHPTSQGYDIITPYIQNAMEEAVYRDVLTVAINVNANRDLRLLTTVDSLRYREVGFSIELVSSKEVATVSTNTVYDSVLVDGTVKTARDISNDSGSEYIAAFIITGVPAGVTITVRAFVTLTDGTTVWGEARTVTVPT